MPTCVVKLNKKKYESVDAMSARLKAEIHMLHRLNITAVKIIHGAANDAEFSESRQACRQYLHEKLASGEIRALCIGEHFGPFEADGRHLADMEPSLRQDPDWSRHNDAIVMVVL